MKITPKHIYTIMYFILCLLALFSSKFAQNFLHLNNFSTIMLTSSYGISWLFAGAIDFKLVDEFELYFQMLSLLVVLIVILWSIFMPSIMQHQSLIQFLTVLASFSTIKTSLKFLYQTAVAHDNKTLKKIRSIIVL